MSKPGVMTTKDWAELESKIVAPFGGESLMCDGYKITLQVQRVSALKYAIAVYVSDEIRGEWLVHDCEERRRFMRREEHRYYSRKDKAALIKRLGKKTATDFFSLDASTVLYTPYWNSFRALKRHLIANNTDIRWMR